MIMKKWNNENDNENDNGDDDDDECVRRRNEEMKWKIMKKMAMKM